ncbi:DUF7426 family protein [Streptomyces liangshanensis]|uniref:DUF7426 family protein n=1 Tax=Streptomyces liangshanensis TaxID=2717324 RepID=UPI0036DEA861
MASRFPALDEALDEGLELPVTGLDGTERIYFIPEPSAEAGLRVEKITSFAAQLATGGTPTSAPVLDDGEEIDLYALCLGETYEQLRAEVSWPSFKRVALTAMIWITADEDTARQFWSTGQHPQQAPNRETRRQQQRSSGSSESAAASGTRSRGSTSGTKAGSRRRRSGGAPAPR